MILSHCRRPWNEFIEFTFRVETFEGGIEDYADIPSDYHEFFFDEFKVEFDLTKYPNHIITGRCAIEISKEDDGYWHLEEVKFYEPVFVAVPASAEAQKVSASEGSNGK